ncbi:MAG TPA: efflux RND transporter periplasmic adaptor subunit [Chthoniobacterales bacterium]|jgi:cobalt-zinc-cadmium efflux system membrane fusion protein|nr:efflux RND transporter periplasmic adaptor subunit [Chthoniobacterales bacterium]
MRRPSTQMLVLSSVAILFLCSCGNGKSDPNAGAPPPLKVERAEDRNVFQVDHPDKFPLTTAAERVTTSQLTATATVNPDISRTVPVISLATGRVVEIKARLGDMVKKGQVLLRVQSADIAGAYSDYQKAVADEQLARTQSERAQLLYDKGAISLNDLQIAQDSEAKAQVDVKTTAEKLRVLGNANLDQPSGVVDIHAPITGVITDQQVTNAGGVAGLSSPNPFTISDLTYVWILCDVYENDLASVRVGEKVDVRLNAYPDKTFTGTISNVSPILDPNLRTAKVRIEVRNPGIMRPGMFGTATFHGQKKEKLAAVPTNAVLHLHDRDWVYVPAGGNNFRRVEVKAGEMLPGDMQEIRSGIAPGQQVIANALEFQNTAEQ